jgi:hypothetical protein
VIGATGSAVGVAERPQAAATIEIDTSTKIKAETRDGFTMSLLVQVDACPSRHAYASLSLGKSREDGGL